MRYYKKCPNCRSVFVSWNWIHTRTFSAWLHNLKFGAPIAWKRPWTFVTDRWAGECWDCGHMIFTMFKVRLGIPQKMLKETYTESTMSLIRDYMDMVYCQIDNWISSTDWKDQTPEERKEAIEFHRKVALREINLLFNEEIDFHKIRKETYYRTPNEYYEEKSKWEEKNNKST